MQSNSKDQTINLENRNVAERNLSRKTFPVFFQFISDLAAISISFLIQYLLVFKSGAIFNIATPDLIIMITGLVGVNFYWLILFYFSGLYKNWYERSPFEEFFTLLKSALVGVGIIYFFVVTDTSKSPRAMILIYLTLLFFTTFTFRTIIRRIQKKLRHKKVISFYSIIVGSKEKIDQVAGNMQTSPSWGLRPIGGILEDESYSDGDNILGNITDLVPILDQYKPDIVVFAANNISHDNLFRIAQECSDRNIRIKIEPDLYSIFTGQAKTHNIYGIPYMEISPQLMKGWEETAKRIFDVVFSALVIVLGLPVWLLVALIIKLESKGPVFYTQPRTGRDEKVFKIYKFRSMVKDADKGKQKWTKVGDPRVTRFGKFIRKTHLDEIPQFLNVFIGDMSVVGPRPEQPHFVEEFNKEVPYYSRRHKVRPGITGWWQIKYKAHELNTDEIKSRLKDDFYYIENMSLTFDIEIVVRTVWAVLSGHGQT